MRTPRSSPKALVSSISPGRKPMLSTTATSACSTSAKSASTTTASGCTGPPRYTSSSGAVSVAIGGTASSTSVSEARLSTTPIAPSSPCSPMSTTVRRKFGSTRAGPATSSCPRREVTRPILARPGRVPGGRAGGALRANPDDEELADGCAGLGEGEYPDAVVAGLEQRPGEAAGGLVELEPRRDLACNSERRGASLLPGD